MKIKINNPSGYEWHAFDDDNYEPGMSLGIGKTGAEAIADLIEHLANDGAFTSAELEFLTTLEDRPMSTWSEAETARYNELTGQSPELGSDALTMSEKVAGLKA
jgi:hypothetical protein